MALRKFEYQLLVALGLADPTGIQKDLEIDHLPELKNLMRAAIQGVLGGKPLHSRLLVRKLLSGV